MVQVVVLAASGDQRTIKVPAVTGAGIAKALRKTVPAERIGTYTDGLSVWGWREGTTENTHELPPMMSGETPVLFGDVVIAASGDFTESDWTAFYQEYTYEEDDDEEEAEEAEAEEAEEGEAEEEGEVEEEEEEAEADAEEAEAEEEEAEDGDCYDEGDENGGGAKRRINKRRSVASEYRRMEMGLKARVKLPVPPGKRAPRWQTAPELEEEGEFTAQREQVLGVIASRVDLSVEHRADLELGIYTASLQEAERKGVRRHWENPDYAMIYSIVARKVLANLDPVAYVGNARLLQRLQDGEFTARQIAFMSPKELYPEHWQPLADAQTKRENIMLEGDKEGGSDMFKCKRCGKSKTKYWEMQTRSADEPMTIFIRCLNCGKEWRQ
jgi:hypothetical protein